jgi:CRISPR type III-B/RAMP module-associated protein Cmr3
MSTSAWLAFTPRDTVFVRDGRSFNAAADAFAQTVLPGPTTMAGAVGAAFGITRDDLKATFAGKSDKPVTQEVRGPILARRHGDGWEPYFPFPADLVVAKEGAEEYVYRLTPGGIQGKTDLDGIDSVLLPPEGVDDVKPVTGWIPGSVLARYLAGQLPAPDGSELKEFDAVEPFQPETRIGLAREDRRARVGFLYQTSHLRFEDDWAFLAEFVMSREPEGQARTHVPFGGKGRLADVEPAAINWPAPGWPTWGVTGKHVLVYLATPGVWPRGWLPQLPPGARLVAAATGDPQPAASVSPGPGWEGTRELRWTVPAGSVYLLEFPDEARGAEWATANHGKAIDRGAGRRPDLLRTAGFGVVLTGAWGDGVPAFSVRGVPGAHRGGGQR